MATRILPVRARKPSTVTSTAWPLPRQAAASGPSWALAGAAKAKAAPVAARLRRAALVGNRKDMARNSWTVPDQHNGPGQLTRPPCRWLIWGKLAAKLCSRGDKKEGNPAKAGLR